MSMMIITDNGKRTVHRCPVKKHLGVFKKPEDTIENDNKPIPEYYSEQHAKDDGWKHTNDIMFCKPGRDFVWVCPECAEEVEWKEKDRPIEFNSRGTKKDKRIKDRRKNSPFFIDKDRRKDKRRDQDRRGKAQREIAKEDRKKFERHLKAQR